MSNCPKAQRRHLRLAFAAALALTSAGELMSGCYWQRQHYLIALSVPDAPVTFQFVDQRPAGDKKPAVEIYAAKHHIGDDQLSPDRMILLRHKIQEHFGIRLAGKAIAIGKFSVVNKYRGDVDQDIADTHQALLSPLINYLITEEIAGNAIICDLRGTVDGRAFGITMQQPYPIRAAPGTVEAQLSRTVVAVIDLAITEIAKNCGC